MTHLEALEVAVAAADHLSEIDAAAVEVARHLAGKLDRQIADATTGGELSLFTQPCPECDAVDPNPCKSKVDGSAMRTRHRGRPVELTDTPTRVGELPASFTYDAQQFIVTLGTLGLTTRSRKELGLELTDPGEEVPGDALDQAVARLRPA